jgi:hypothetical protein
MHKGYGRHLHSKIASEPGTRVEAIVARMARKERRDGASLLNLFEYLRHKALHSPGCLPQGQERILERAKGIEPSYAAWEAAVLPLNYARIETQ